MNVLLALAVVAVVSVAAQTGGIFERAVGPCINDRCQDDHECYYGQCIPNGVAPKMKIPDPSTAIGDCQHGGLCKNDQFCHKGKCYKHPTIGELL